MAVSRQIKKNAAKVAGTLQADWSRAYWIACSVEPGEGQGARADLGRGQPKSGKVSGREFAEEVSKAAGGSVYGMGRQGILAVRAKWDEIAAEHSLPLSQTLRPVDAETEPDYPDIAWKRENGDTGSKVVDIQKNPKAVAKAMEKPEFRKQVLDKMPEPVVAELDDDVDDARFGREVAKRRRRKTKEWQAEEDEWQQTRDQGDLGLHEKVIKVTLLIDDIAKAGHNALPSLAEIGEHLESVRLGIEAGTIAANLTPEMFK